MCVGESKVVLLGRPTAFISDEEYQYALHGKRNIGDIEINDENWPDYREFTIQPFTKIQVNKFLTNYFDCKKRQAENARKKAFSLNESTLDKITGKQFSDIARRPVQLKMLAEVLPQFRGSIDRITSAVLYDEFINLMIERELEKISRKRFNKEDRRLFVESVAWWLWVEKGEMSTIQYKIPDKVVVPFCRPRDEVDAVRRDLTAACFLERKYGGALYFPHRSFQEYLVSERLYKGMLSGKIDLSILDEISNPEILEFLRVMTGHQQIAKWSSPLSSFRGNLPWGFVRVCIDDEMYGNYYLERFKDDVNSPWWQLILAIGFNAGKFKLNPNVFSFYHHLKNDSLKPPKLTDEQLLYELLAGILVLGATGDSHFFLNALSLIGRNSSKMHRDFLSRMNFSSKRLGYMDIRGAYKHLGTYLGKSACVSEWIKSGNLQTDQVTLPEYVNNGDDLVMNKLHKEQLKLQ